MKKHIRNENIFTNLFHCSDSQVIFCSLGLKKIVWFFVCYINLIVARFIILLPGLYTTTQKVESCSIKNPIQKVRNIFQTTLSTLPTYLTAKKFQILHMLRRPKNMVSSKKYCGMFIILSLATIFY
jgi:hypothetical protein